MIKSVFLAATTYFTHFDTLSIYPYGKKTAQQMLGGFIINDLSDL